MHLGGIPTTSTELTPYLSSTYARTGTNLECPDGIGSVKGNLPRVQIPLRPPSVSRSEAVWRAAISGGAEVREALDRLTVPATTALADPRGNRSTSLGSDSVGKPDAVGVGESVQRPSPVARERGAVHER
jgi:hypothetical protein